MNLKVRDRNRTKNRLNKTSATLVCKNCNRMFTINIGEICWHYDMGNLIPGFCPECREKRKAERLKRKFDAKHENETEEKLIEEN